MAASALLAVAETPKDANREGSSSSSAQAQAQSDTQTEPKTAFDAQILLSRRNFSPGVIDGKWGDNTRSALRAFQRAHGLEVTGELDEATRKELADGQPLTHEVQIAEEVVAGPFLDSLPGSLNEQAELDSLSYISVLEALGEEYHVTPELLREHNPDAQFAAGETITVPNVARPEPPTGDLTITVSKSNTDLEVTDADGNVLFFAPVTAGSTAEPLPIGEWEVVAIATDPTFHYNPSLFEDAPKDAEEATLPPGPNNPVGVVWIDLNKEHYGIHGTPEPAKIGYDESHGCVRLANWDASYLAQMVDAGTKVVFRE